MKKWRLTILALALSALTPAWAQQSDSMPMNHEGMTHDHMGMSHDMDAEAESSPSPATDSKPSKTSPKPNKPESAEPVLEHDAEHGMPAGMNHDGMVHGTEAGANATMSHDMDHGSHQVMEVESSKAVEPDAGTAMSHDSMSHGMNAEADGDASHGMDHGAMPVMKVVSSEQVPPEVVEADMTHDTMQGGSPPADARDPHAYSGGYDFGPIPRPRLADEHYFGSLLIDQLEYTESSDDNAVAYDVQGWFGRDYNRAVLKAEGEIDDGELQESRTELLWGHAIAAYWDTQLGVRHDSNGGPDRNWLAFGIQGLAPYWFEFDAAAYVGDEGRSALRLDAEYELLFTQRLILQPRIEANFYGKRDPERGLGSGLSDAVAGLRLRYEIKRQFGPYIGVEWQGLYGETADFAEAADNSTDETRWVAGFRAWF